MRLVSVEGRGYKRFAEPAKMNVDGKIIAIVGPNEAGKTSFLELVEHLSNDNGIEPEVQTRGGSIGPTDVVVAARFLLDHEDYQAIQHLHGANTGRHRWLLVEKRQNGRFATSVEPALRRNLEGRRRAADGLQQLLKSPWLEGELEDGDSSLYPETIKPVIEALTSNARHLGSEVLDTLHAATERLGELATEERPQYAAKIIDRLRSVHVHEDDPHPTDQARQILFDRRPDVLVFDDEARGLAYEYDLATAAASPPPALGNLTHVAGLDLMALRNAIQTGETGTASYLLEEANVRLKEEFAAWTQSGVRPHLDRGDALLLHVHVSNDAGGYMRFTERSAGLRSFVALVAMASTARRGGKPILLVDEAEMHLHYDAQADLVAVFTRQDAAAQVIYTTHSAGCLPEDLGTGVRIIEPVLGTNHSRIRNKFWTQEPGFSPLLLGMGASTLAFFPTRNGLVTEGPTELVMLPTLMREATGLDELRFQVAPGSSNAKPAQVAGLDLQAPRVAWLVDGDNGGRGLTKKLRKNHIAKERIVSLGGAMSGLVIEDLVHPEVYVDAANEEMGRRGADNAMPVDALSEKNRPASVEAWCESKGIPTPDKIAVAHHVVEMRETRSLVDADRVAVLVQTHREVLEALGLDGS